MAYNYRMTAIGRSSFTDIHARLLPAALRIQLHFLDENFRAAVNEQYRFRGQKSAEADIAHSHRQQRLQEIQEELVQLSKLGRQTLFD